MKIITTITLASSLILTNAAWAAQQPSQTTEDQRVTAAMSQLTTDMTEEFKKEGEALRQELKALFKAGFKFANQQNYQSDPNLPEIEKANTTKVGDTVSNAAQTSTQGSIDYVLTQLNYSMNPTDPSYKDFKTQMQNNGLHALSGVQTVQGKGGVFSSPSDQTAIYPADDSLFLVDPAGKQLGSSSYLSGSSGTTTPTSDELTRYISKPQTRQNDMLNFASLLTPMAYSTTQLQAAQNYLKFATQNTMDLFPQKPTGDQETGGLFGKAFNFNTITATTLSKPNQAKALYYLKQDPRYQRFVFNLRSRLAMQSVSTNILNQLVAERTTVSRLGTQAGLSTPDGKPLPDASPLQVESYIANHRIQDSSWYNHMQNASPATVQRNILIVLAEIEHQNYEAHLDRERLLAELAVMNLNSSQQSMDTFMQIESAKVNTAITDAVNKTAGVVKPISPTQNQNQAPQFTNGKNNTQTSGGEAGDKQEQNKKLKSEEDSYNQ